MGLSHWTNKWVLMLIAGIAIQAVAYPLIWNLQLFTHQFFSDVFVICIGALVIQFIGFSVIMAKTKNQDPKIYAQGRPFKHKLREEDKEEATRKPTFTGTTS
ncbi:MAG: hypothetical protein C4K49_03390 [Candidatus Thorarchaeota archaeon]|nr:MAG: hypothetical protein C4K49_03390 [Candidatus Thorarchaeota archaeon]